MTEQEAQTKRVRAAILDLTREAMSSGVAWLNGNIGRLRSEPWDFSLSAAMGDWPERFLGIRGDLTAAIEDAIGSRVVAAPSDTDMDSAALSAFPDSDKAVYPAAIVAFARDAFRKGWNARTSQPVQVEVTEHKITQQIPWLLSPDADYMLSRFECSCGWAGGTFKDLRTNWFEIAAYRGQAYTHAALEVPVSPESEGKK